MGRSVLDYTAFLAARYVNLVPVHGFRSVLKGIWSITQTCGVYPLALHERLTDEFALAGVQRIIPLGGNGGGGSNAAVPQDGIEVLRHMCRWIVKESEAQTRVFPVD